MMYFRHGEAGYFYSKPVCRSIRRLKRGQYVYEQLFYGVFGGEPAYYISTETFKVRFPNVRSHTELRRLTRDEALAWAKANLWEGAYKNFV